MITPARVVPVLAGLLAAVASAGPLTPPVGPVAPTGKTTQEVFDKAAAAEPRIAINATNTPGDADSLFKITQRGSYYLTGNITGVVGKHGIEIAASGVTIDLNGFDLVGTAGMGAFDGVNVTVLNLTTIEVRNGSVRSWGDKGIDLALAESCVVQQIRSSGNAGSGISSGPAGTLRACVAFANTGAGITCGSGVTIDGCLAFGNGSFGISMGSGSTMSACAAYNNTSDGINAGLGSSISNCTAYNNSGNGITTSTGCTIAGCSALTNTLNGIDVGLGCNVTRCTAYGNDGIGISANDGCSISGCTIDINGLDGMQFTNRCIVLNNTSSNHDTGAGIHATGTDNRIEGNHCLDNIRGIDVDAVANIIIKNTCSGNTLNWSIVAGNHYGPIIDRTAVAAPPAVNGNAAPEALGSAHPNANFTY